MGARQPGSVDVTPSAGTGTSTHAGTHSSSRALLTAARASTALIC